LQTVTKIKQLKNHILFIACPNFCGKEGVKMHTINLKRCLLAMLFSILILPLQGFAEDNGFQELKIPETKFEEPRFTGNKIHMHLGLAAIIAAAITGITAPDSEGAVNTGQTSKNTVHYYAANATAALSAAAVVSGLYLHLDDISLDYGITDPDMMHMILTTVGTAAYFYAISKAPKVLGGNSNGHATAGILGAGLMFTGIALEW